MRCSDIRRLSTAYVDGELDNTRTSAMRGHLRECESCLELVDFELAIVEELADADATLDPPGALWSDIDQALARAEVTDAGRSRLSLWWSSVRPHAPLVAIAAVTAVTVVLWIRGPATTEPTTAEPIQVPVTDYNAKFAPSTSPAAPKTHKEVLVIEIGRADQRYLQAIAELRAIATEERQQWSAADAKEFDRNALYAVYRQQIIYLQQAALSKEAEVTQ